MRQENGNECSAQTVNVSDGRESLKCIVEKTEGSKCSYLPSCMEESQVEPVQMLGLSALSLIASLLLEHSL